MDEEELIVEWLYQLDGIGDAKFLQHYSEYTGYLWTDEEFNVEGHNILEELSSFEGKYLFMVIEYSKEEKNA